MIQRARRFLVELHEDESGPNTVEWILLIIVGLLVLIAIYAFVNWVIGKFGEAKDAVDNEGVDPL
jgi:Flp pilus assembly pilin Flp